MIEIITGIYFLLLSYITLFSLTQLYLAIYALQSKHYPVKKNLLEYPLITLQLPVYNEKYVVTRLIESICALNYPKNLMQIQILDDSTDETTTILKKIIKEKQDNGYWIDHIRRNNRKGYKAGALSEGLTQTKGEFIAIFDADFVPVPDFLKSTLHYFSEPTIGLVQTAWGHLNQGMNWLTHLQAMGLNGHFMVEQTGRQQLDAFINFNGTGGIWRKACILDAGSWDSDTLTEDLDLSYRAQLKGWKLKYLPYHNTPAELPTSISAVKSQQYRWTKGTTETAIKLLPSLWKSGVNLKTKILGTFHLLNSTVYLLLLLSSLLSFPMLIIKNNFPEYGLYFRVGSFFLIGFIAITIFYIISEHLAHNLSWSFVWKFPFFISYTLGLTLYNSWAVIQGILGIRTPFIRTPKAGHIGKSLKSASVVYHVKPLTLISWIEIAAFIYFVIAISYGIEIKDFGLLFFHFLLAVGYLFVGVNSIMDRNG